MVEARTSPSSTTWASIVVSRFASAANPDAEVLEIETSARGFFLGSMIPTVWNATAALVPANASRLPFESVTSIARRLLRSFAIRSTTRWSRFFLPIASAALNFSSFVIALSALPALV